MTKVEIEYSVWGVNAVEVQGMVVLDLRVLEKELGQSSPIEPQIDLGASDEARMVGKMVGAMAKGVPQMMGLIMPPSHGKIAIPHQKYEHLGRPTVFDTIVITVEFQEMKQHVQNEREES